jgi:hypothetical protein
MSDEARRQNDIAVARMEQKLDDALNQLRQHITWSEAYKTDHNERLRKLEAIMNQIERPVKAVGWTVTILATGGLLYIGQDIIQWFQRHFHG